MTDIERLENNIAKLDVMIEELEKKLQALEASKVLMKEKISTIKFHKQIIKVKHIVKLDELIDGIKKKYNEVKKYGNI